MAGRPLLSARAWRRRFEEAGVEAQPGDEADIPAHCGDEIERGETGVGDDDDLAFWQPSPNLEDGLARKVRQLFVAAPMRGVVALGRGEDGQERQAPASLGPGHGNHGHDSEPAQPAGLDEMPMRGAHRIAVDSACGNLGPPAAFDRIVEADHHRPRWRKVLDDHRQQFAGDGAAAPARMVEHIVIAREIFGRAEAHDAQGGAHRALARRKNHAGDQDEQMAPNRGGEELPERLHQRGDDGRQGLCRGGEGRGAMLGHRKVGIPWRRIVINASQ